MTPASVSHFRARALPGAVLRLCQGGFTLIEMIVVIVLLGVLAIGASNLIVTPVQSYHEQLKRKQLVDSAQMALHRIEIDIHNALPNSVRIIDHGPATWALEMVDTVDGARYRDEPGTGFANASDILSFTAAGGDQQFNLLGLFSNLPVAGLPVTYPAYRVVIYNTSASQIYGDAAAGNNPGVISPAGVTLNIDPTGVEHQLTLASPFRFKYRSPTQRLFLVDGAITYLCDSSSGYLLRFDQYGYHSSQTAVDSVAKLLALGARQTRVATQVSRCDINYQPGSPQRSSLITLNLALSDASNESVQLLHQVHVDNTP